MSTSPVPNDLVELDSTLTFADTIDRLDAEIAANGLTIFTRIDHAANATEVGLDLPPTTVLVFGNARGGTPLMRSAPALAIDLPLRLLVRQDGDRVVVSYHDPTIMTAGYGLAPWTVRPLRVIRAIATTVAAER